MAFTKGTSGNPTGRPRGARGLARYISEQTGDGQELVDRLLELSRDARAPTRERFAAVTSLLDRMAGRPMQPSEIAMSLETTAIVYPVGWASFEPEQRREWLLSHRERLLLSDGGS